MITPPKKNNSQQKIKAHLEIPKCPFNKILKQREFELQMYRKLPPTIAAALFHVVPSYIVEPSIGSSH